MRFTQDEETNSIIDNYDDTMCECKNPQEMKLFTSKLNKLYCDVKDLALICEKQAEFLKSKGFELEHFIEFIGESNSGVIEDDRFESLGRILIDNETRLHYIMTLDWEVSLIVKLLNKQNAKINELQDENIILIKDNKMLQNTINNIFSF